MKVRQAAAFHSWQCPHKRIQITRCFIWVPVIILVLSLTGCGGNTSPEGTVPAATGTEAYGGYRFICSSPSTGGDVVLLVGENPAEALEALGEPLSFYEAPSCALPGSDRIYTYSGFELAVNHDSTDTLISVRLTDDSFTTEEGIYIGSTAKEVVAAYGDCTPVSGEFTYQMGEMELSFLTQKEVVSSIEYRLP